MPYKVRYIDTYGICVEISFCDSDTMYWFLDRLSKNQIHVVSYLDKDNLAILKRRFRNE